MDDIQSIVKTYILEQFLPSVDPADLTATTPLIGSGILDSLATVRLVMFLEERFGIAVHAYEANPENLGSLEQITSLVRQKQAAP